MTPLGNRRLRFLEPDIPFTTRLPPWLRRFAMAHEQQKRPVQPTPVLVPSTLELREAVRGRTLNWQRSQDDDAIGVGERVTDREEAGLRGRVKICCTERD